MKKITDQNDEDTPVMEVENKAGNKSNERMLNLLSLEQNKELTLQGTEEIKYRLELNHIENIDDITFVSYKGMIDETNLRCIGTFGFYIDYLVTKDEIYQIIKIGLYTYYMETFFIQLINNPSFYCIKHKDFQ